MHAACSPTLQVANSASTRGAKSRGEQKRELEVTSMWAWPTAQRASKRATDPLRVMFAPMPEHRAGPGRPAAVVAFPCDPSRTGPQWIVTADVACPAGGYDDFNCWGGVPASASLGLALLAREGNEKAGGSGNCKWQIKHTGLVGRLFQSQADVAHDGVDHLPRVIRRGWTRLLIRGEPRRPKLKH